MPDLAAVASAAMSKSSEATGIEGCFLFRLSTHEDDRGSLTEIIRQSWNGSPAAIQWNYVRNRAGVLRGMHGHIKHFDYLVMLEGSMFLALRDLRRNSPTKDRSLLMRLNGSDMSAIVIPPGVAHGFYFPEPAIHIYGVTEYWVPVDELGCRWDDPGLEIAWPTTQVQVSPRDAALPSLADFVRQMDEGLARNR